LAESICSGSHYGQAERDIDRAGRSLSTALKLIEDLVSQARAEAIQIEWRAVDVRALINDIAQATRAEAEMKNLRLSIDLPGEFPPIQTDPTRVRQILGNLISNALKYTDSGDVTLRMSGRDRDNRKWAVVDAADTGPGIAKDQPPLLFDEFRGPTRVAHQRASIYAARVRRARL
jgi:signal transduction histidine kinase